MNKWNGTGRPTKDAEARATQTGIPVATFYLAVDRPKQDTADFFPVVCFDKTATFAAKYVKKGIKYAITGHLQNSQYTNKDGVKITVTNIVAEQIEFCERKNVETAVERVQAETAVEQFVSAADIEDLPFN
jgi:single-strand DNA-binding protein